MLDRRQFVRTVAAAVALAPGWGGATAATGTGVSLTGVPGREVFRALRLQPFTLWLDSRAEGLFLVRVDDDDSDAHCEQFTVVFLGPLRLALSEGVYRVSHATAGTTHLFLQAAGTDHRYSYHKATFNLLRT
jgi:hypothetical protein